MWKRTGVTMGAIGAAVAAGALFGCSQQPQAKTAANEDKVFAMSPSTVKVQAGPISGELRDLKVTETVESGSGKVVVPPSLSGTIDLKNDSADQAVSLISGKIVYLDAAGKPIALAADRTAPALAFSSYGTSNALNPGKETSQMVNLDFPADALKNGGLKDIRVELAYTVSPYRDEKLSFPVTVSAR